jgi:hypothetical protein
MLTYKQESPEQRQAACGCHGVIYLEEDAPRMASMRAVRIGDKRLDIALLIGQSSLLETLHRQVCTNWGS